MKSKAILNAMIEISNETILTIQEARLEFPNEPSAATVWRWVLKGVSGTVLASVRIGGRRFTSKEACRRFIEERNQPADPGECKQERRQAFEIAQTILDHYGV